VITFPEFKAELETLLNDVGCAVLSTSDVIQTQAVEAADREWPAYSPDKIAFLQHSSGTTGLQKGVALSHRAVLNQIGAYGRAIELTSQDVIVSWLPLYHDMGLIAGFVMPLIAGATLVLMSPFRWVWDPKILLQTISIQRGTLCWLPNFAYNHSARVIRPRECEWLDLSSMRAFINCSEPVYLQSQQVFLEKFRSCGLRESMLSTCYAMAENTFAVTQNPPGKTARVDWVSTRSLQEEQRAIPTKAEAHGSTPMVSCGFPISGTEIHVVDEQGEPLPDRSVGEIALRSDCMLSGYYRRPDLTADAIRGGWYHTGDMGYISSGELFITGRKKDLIIVGGKNIYPQDLEAIANHIPGLVPGRSVAFGLYDPALGSENIVMVCELEHSPISAEAEKKLEMELRRQIVQQSEVALSDVRFVARRWLIKTSSGKISRAANREKYLRHLSGK
jgi:acyl-CoA synthetase (AMP-forming)/AMP-acid ligase II